MLQLEEVDAQMKRQAKLERARGGRRNALSKAGGSPGRRTQKLQVVLENDAEEGKRVGFEEDANSMMRRLAEESKRLDRRRREEQFASRIQPFFTSGIYELAKQHAAQAEGARSVDGEDDASDDSHRSDGLYSEHASDGDVELASTDRERARDGRKARDNFMKGIERRLAHAQGLRGFGGAKKKATAETEAERAAVLTKMFLAQVLQENQKATDATRKQQKELDEAHTKEKARVASAQLSERSSASSQERALARGARAASMRAETTLEGDATIEVEVFQDGESQGSDDAEGGNFFEELKAERAHDTLMVSAGEDSD